MTLARAIPRVALASVLLAPCSAVAIEAGPRVELVESTTSGLTVALLGLDPRQLDGLRGSAEARWPDWFSLHVADRANPPVAARYAVVGERVELRPRFPLEGGLEYVAVFRQPGLEARLASAAPGAGSIPVPDAAVAPTVEHRFEVPRARVEPTTTVAAILPSTGVVPENLLKFYVHFSAPMTRGRAYRHLRILDARGEEVELAFLELEYELWDPESRRLTLLFDPGRLKAGLKPRREVGSALHDGFDFALEVDREWPDAEGNPLREGTVYRFRVVPPDHEQPDPESWDWGLPRAGTREPLVVDLGETLDAALLEHSLWVVDGASGRDVEGRVQLANGESEWRFTPDTPWGAGEHELRVDVLLEDLAGNSVARPFEVDLSTDPGSAQTGGEGPEVWIRSFVPRS